MSYRRPLRQGQAMSKKERARTFEERHAYGLRDGVVVCLRCGKSTDPVGRVGLLWDAERCPAAPMPESDTTAGKAQPREKDRAER